MPEEVVIIADFQSEGFGFAKGIYDYLKHKERNVGQISYFFLREISFLYKVSAVPI